MDQQQFDNLLEALWDRSTERYVGESLARINDHLELLCLMKFAELDFPGARKALREEWDQQYKLRWVE